MKFFYFTIFLNILNAFGPPIKVCKQDMIMTYNLIPYRVPVRMKYNICPYMSSTCCSLYDQYDIYNIWRNETKPTLERTYDEIERMVKFIMRVKWRKLLKKVKVSRRRRVHLYKILLTTLAQNLPKRISSAVFMQRQSAEYFMKLRSQFFCQICDGNNQLYFRPHEKTLIISHGSCLQIAQKTIDYAFMMYRRVFFGLSRFSEVIKEFSLDSIPQLLEYEGLKKKIQHIMSCRTKKEPDGTIEQGCRKYCEYFTMNSISPEMEGDIRYLDKTLHYIAKFIKENYTLMPLSERILETRDFIYDKQQEKIVKEPRPLIDPYREPDGLTDEDIKQIFKSDTINQTQESLETFAKSYLSYFDPKLDFGVGNPWKVFNFKSFEQVDLENYTTLIENRGIDLYNKDFQLQDLKINKPIDQIVEQIKNKKEDELPNEVLDDKLVVQINSVDDKYLKGFHADLFMDFDPQKLDQIDIDQFKRRRQPIQQVEEEELEMPKEEEEPTETQKAKEKVESTIEDIKAYPQKMKTYVKDYIDDLQYGKKPTI